MTQTIIKIGNSEGLTLPKELRKKVGLKKGAKVDVSIDINNNILITKQGKKKKVSPITPEFLSWMKKFSKEYGPALKELANK